MSKKAPATTAQLGRLSVCTFATGIAYADRTREKNGDYVRLAFLSFRTLRLEWSPDGVCASPALREAIEAEAARIQARRGELYPVSACGQTVRLGGQS